MVLWGVGYCGVRGSSSLNLAGYREALQNEQVSPSSLNTSLLREGVYSIPYAEEA